MANRTSTAVLLVVILALLGSLGVQAQTSTPEAERGDAPAVVEFTHQGFIYDFETSESMRVEVTNRTDNLNGEWVTFVAMVQLPGGQIVALTPCDDLATPCAPVTTAALGSLEDVENGAQLVLETTGS